jgi:predicted neuraminidase
MTIPGVRGILVLLALALNAWPWFEQGSRTVRFLMPTLSPSSAAPAANTVPLFREEFVDPKPPHAMSHVASIAELPNGLLAATWYAGSREGASDVAIYFSTRSPAEGRWSPPRAVVTRETAARDLNRYIKKVGNAVIFADRAGTLWLLYVTVSVGGWSGSSLNLTTSTDEGVTWTAGRRLTLSPFFNLAELVKNAPVAVADGGWVVPIYHELASTFPELLWLRTSEGRFHATKSRISAGWYGYQPALTPLDDDSALAVLRDDGATKSVAVARSDDAGRRWSRPEIAPLPNPDSGLDAIRLSDGRLLIAFNDSVSGRDNLRLAMSRDDGRTWGGVATLADEAGGDFSYPFLMQARSGEVHLVYTWKRTAIRHVTFNTAWLDERRSPSTQ